MHYRDPRRRRERDKGPEKIFEEIIAENSPTMGKGTVNQVQEAQTPRQAKPKEDHADSHSNQTDTNHRHR